MRTNSGASSFRSDTLGQRNGRNSPRLRYDDFRRSSVGRVDSMLEQVLGHLGIIG